MSAESLGSGEDPPLLLPLIDLASQRQPAAPKASCSKEAQTQPNAGNEGRSHKLCFSLFLGIVNAGTTSDLRKRALEKNHLLKRYTVSLKAQGHSQLILWKRTFLPI